MPDFKTLAAQFEERAIAVLAQAETTEADNDKARSEASALELLRLASKCRALSRRAAAVKSRP